MRTSRSAGIAAVLMLLLSAIASEGQERRGGEAAYFRAVALYFELPESEIAILDDWALPADEIPVVLFMARRAGVSAEALVALRQSGHPWAALSDRYSVGAAALHVPIADPASAGALSALYEEFGSTPAQRWGSIRLDDRQIVTLVNLRVLSQVLGLAPREIAPRIADSTSFVQLYTELVR